MRNCMDWRAATFDWNRARAFLVAAEEGSFSAAAKVLQVAQPTLGRQVAALEDELGVALLERAGNKLVLTPTGASLIEYVRAMREAAHHLSLTAAGQVDALHGVVRLATSEGVAAYLLPPLLDELRRAHPGIEVELVLSNAASDLLRREADIAVRHFRPAGADLVARRLRDSAAYLYGAKRYLDRFGPPRGPDDLHEVQVIGYLDHERFLPALTGLGLSATLDNLRVRTDSQVVQWHLARAGQGLCLMMSEVGEADATMARAWPGVPPVTVPMWLTAHRELRTNPRIRVVFDALAEALSGEGDDEV